VPTPLDARPGHSSTGCFLRLASGAPRSDVCTMCSVQPSEVTVVCSSLQMLTPYTGGSHAVAGPPRSRHRLSAPGGSARPGWGAASPPAADAADSEERLADASEGGGVGGTRDDDADAAARSPGASAEPSARTPARAEEGAGPRGNESGLSRCGAAS
jgi:hypothetical protein